MTSVTPIPILTVIEADWRTSTSLGTSGFLCITEAFSVQLISLRTFARQFPPFMQQQGTRLEKDQVAIHPKAVDGQGLHAIAGVCFSLTISL